MASRSTIHLTSISRSRKNEPEYTAKIAPGRQEINGDQALVYSRMRYQDPEGDYGRQKRQREVIKKIVEKVLSLNSLSHYKGIIESVSDNMQTNIALDSNSLLQLLGYKDALSTIHQYQLKGRRCHLSRWREVIRLSLQNIS